MNTFFGQYVWSGIKQEWTDGQRVHAVTAVIVHVGCLVGGVKALTHLVFNLFI